MTILIDSTKQSINTFLIVNKILLSDILKISLTNNHIKIINQIEININNIFQIDLLMSINQNQHQRQFYFSLVNRYKSQTKTRQIRKIKIKTINDKTMFVNKLTITTSNETTNQKTIQTIVTITTSTIDAIDHLHIKLKNNMTNKKKTN